MAQLVGEQPANYLVTLLPAFLLLSRGANRAFPRYWTPVWPASQSRACWLFSSWLRPHRLTVIPSRHWLIKSPLDRYSILTHHLISFLPLLHKLHFCFATTPLVYLHGNHQKPAAFPKSIRPVAGYERQKPTIRRSGNMGFIQGSRFKGLYKVEKRIVR